MNYKNLYDEKYLVIEEHEGVIIYDCYKSYMLNETPLSVASNKKHLIRARHISFMENNGVCTVIVTSDGTTFVLNEINLPIFNTVLEF